MMAGQEVAFMEEVLIPVSPVDGGLSVTAGYLAALMRAF